MTIDDGRVAEATGLSQVEPASSLAPTGFDPSRGWRPIDTAPLNTLVDLWCIEGYEETASYSTGVSIGYPVSRRHKSAEYGWFGNQSNGGVPRAGGRDMIPVAWRPAVPDCPREMIAEVLGIPISPSDSDGSPKGRDAQRLDAEHDSAGA